jgi:Acyl-CoA synthetases (AMP-forming)/AMP-acid ligases II
MPVAAQVLGHARACPRRLAVQGPDGGLDYAGLARRARAGARHLAGLGAEPGMLAAITLADPVEQIVAVLAADLAGVVPLLCDHGWTADRRDRILRAVPVGLHIDRPLPVTPRQPVGTVRPRACHAPGRVATDPRAAPGVAGGAEGPWVTPRPEDLAWANFSSGSTGRPRAVIRTRGSWTGSFPHLNRIAGIGPGDVVLVPGPLVSSLYGFAAVHALATGATAVVPGRWSPDGLAGHLRTATAVHLVPHHLPVVLDALAEAAGPLRTAIAGGAALPDETRAAAARAGVRVVAYYGATELSFVAVDADGSGLRPFPEVEIEVRTPPGERLGEVWVRSPWLSAGYAAGTRGPLRVDGGGWMTVGDLAEPYRPGEPLRVRGRGDGAIQVGGATVVPEDVESVLRHVPGVRDVVVVAAPHPRLGAVVTAVLEHDGDPPSRAVLETAARDGLDPAQRPRRWYTTTALPRTPTGKPARALVAARLAEGGPGMRRLERPGAAW